MIYSIWLLDELWCILIYYVGSFFKIVGLVWLLKDMWYFEKLCLILCESKDEIRKILWWFVRLVDKCLKNLE